MFTNIRTLKPNEYFDDQLEDKNCIMHGDSFELNLLFNLMILNADFYHLIDITKAAQISFTYFVALVYFTTLYSLLGYCELQMKQILVNTIY